MPKSRTVSKAGGRRGVGWKPTDRSPEPGVCPAPMSKTTPTRKRRWMQFSLRSLFVVTALLAVWIGYHVNRARNQQKAVETVLRLGGTLYFDYQLEEDG